MRPYSAMRRIAFVFGLLTFAPEIRAEESQLRNLRSILIPLRANAEKYPVENRGAVPELTTVKHQIRDWIESRLNSLDKSGDEKAIERAINADIKAAGLTSSEDRENFIGFLNDIELS